MWNPSSWLLSAASRDDCSTRALLVAKTRECDHNIAFLAPSDRSRRYPSLAGEALGVLCKEHHDPLRPLESINTTSIVEYTLSRVWQKYQITDLSLTHMQGVTHTRVTFEDDYAL